ncbi:MAG: shikimate dehydrogenase [Firmicutes bacterium]|nr:shikimate dehydrogenase [Bacillota bacterium]
MLLGLFGHPLEHSLSPAMHTAAMKELQIEGDYLLFDVLDKKLKTAIEGLFALGVIGFNVTIPYKRQIISYLDEITPEAKEIGAVNLVYKKSIGKKTIYVGDNSDAPGFIISLINAGIDLSLKKALVLGSGGAARAICVGLKNRNIEITVASRSRPQESFWDQFRWLELHPDLVIDTDLVINCTPCGMYPNVDDRPLVNPASFPTKTHFCDIVYNPLRTKFIKIAEETGHKTITGEGMLLYQGAISFEKWFNTKAPIEAMRKALISHLQGGNLND